MSDEEAERPSSWGLVDIFNQQTKRELEAHCRSIVITGENLAGLIAACMAETIPIRHIPVFQHHHPEHLTLEDADLSALASNGVGPLSPAARKTVNKLDEMFRQRRMLANHMFWIPELVGKWWLFHFDDKDQARHGNHWAEGPHIHLRCHLTHPQADPNALLEELRTTARPKIRGSLHIRYRR